MARIYDHRKIEKKWQRMWKKQKLYQVTEKPGQKKSYVLDMFPYPSGEGLHVGHPKGYIATDVYSRYKRMQGFNILHPMGFDAFGLPAENFAIKNKIHPKKAVDKNVAYFKEQLSRIGFNYDWDREINTTDPAYYKWTQWIFLELYKKGLAYQSFEPINWCPSCKTGLANEDVEDGKCERCGTPVEKKPLRQWVLRITKYADRLLKDLEGLNWPESIKESQRNWIGRSEGAEISFELLATSFKDAVKVFTTRPDTIFGATYLVLAPEHAAISNLKSQISNWNEVEAYIAHAKEKTEIERTAQGKEKTGVELQGVKAVNPANGEKIPMWIADYVLADYGTGAIMAVPAHDERDFQFASKYKLPIRTAIRTSQRTLIKFVSRSLIPNWEKRIPAGMKYVKNEDFLTFSIPDEQVQEFISIGQSLLKDGPYYFSVRNDIKLIVYKDKSFNVFDSDQNEAAEAYGKKKQITERELAWGTAMIEEGYMVNSGIFTGTSSQEGKKKVTEFVKGQWVTQYKLRDWVFSRQRYWGEPIPIIHCDSCGAVPVPQEDLPVKLPNVKHYEPSGTGESPLANIKRWVNVKCPKCQGKAKRETNTMPQWAGSSWYYLRYMDPDNTRVLVDPEKEKYWAPVDLYVGGAEHATRHLIYARFWHKFLHDIGVVSTSEPFARLQHVGLIIAEDGRKMSKRYGNVINPDDIVETYGADTLRVYEMFMGPFDQSIAWNTQSLIGARRFLDRIFRLLDKGADSATLQVGTEALLHQTIKKVGEDIEAMKFNTALSQLMILSNALEKESALDRGVLSIYVRLLAPFAPHVAEEMWSLLDLESSIHEAPWPQFDPHKLLEDRVRIVVQVNGKVRGTLVMPRGSDRQAIEEKVKSEKEIQKWLQNQTIAKVIFVPDKLVNFVIA